MMTFDGVVDQERLRECLAGGTGKGVKVGILDSGVASDLPELHGRVVGNYEVVEYRRGKPEIVALSKGEDVIEHGTACAYIIHKHAPDAELHSIRVIGASHSATSARLLAALEFAVEQKWDILNLSLGTESSYEQLSRLADRAYYQGMLWVAAKDNKRNKVGYPAGLASVVGVDMDYFENPLNFRFHSNQVTEVEASGVYVDAPTPGGGWQQFTGTSFACPQIAGIAAKLREHFPDLTAFQLKAALASLRGNP
ncbi:MAG: S8 family serine peptidase [Verrucomicrobiales bacterium]|jgi:subtilisin family serine protease|nr:S8 family serine peptidase [Verrucomicrobiales bacterium]